MEESSPAPPCPITVSFPIVLHFLLKPDSTLSLFSSVLQGEYSHLVYSATFPVYSPALSLGRGNRHISATLALW
jgi:hypothetical protein